MRNSIVIYPPPPHTIDVPQAQKHWGVQRLQVCVDLFYVQTHFRQGALGHFLWASGDLD